MYSPLTSPQRVTRWLILQKARGQTTVHSTAVLPLLVSTRFQVLFHSGYPGSFHLSLTVLVHYRSPKVFSLGEWTPLLPTGLACPVVLWLFGRSSLSFRYRTITFCGGPFQCPSPKQRVSYSLELMWQLHRRLNPICTTTTLLHANGLGFFPFARHYSGNIIFSWGY